MFICVERLCPVINITTLNSVCFVDVIDMLNDFLINWLFIKICIWGMLRVLYREDELEADRSFSIVDLDWNLSSKL
jgi:hypothetical protein